MASNLRVDSIVPATGSSVSIGTATGGVNIPGVLTYEDVTNVDSVGVITARDGLRVTGIATISGDVSIADKIIHTGDTNTSLRFPAADTFTVETGGSERLRIDSNGSVRVGDNSSYTANANADNLIVGTTNSGNNNGISIISHTNSEPRLIFASSADDDAGMIKYAFSTNIMQFYTSGSEKLRISSAGYVTKPNQPVFDVCGASGNPSGAGYITFTTVKVNIGSHYSTGTGKFIAPVAGTYFFSFGCIKSGNSSLARLYLYKNGSSANGRQLRMPTGGDGYGENGAKTNIVTLAANDEIQVYMSEGTIHGGTAYLYFNGYLIG